MSIRKPAERIEARRLREEEGFSVKDITRALGVSQGSVSVWVRDIVLTPEQEAGILAGRREKHLMNASRRAEGKARARKSRTAEHRAEADKMWPTLQAQARFMFLLGLYVGEGDKTRGQVGLTNAEPWVVLCGAELFMEYLGVPGSALQYQARVPRDEALLRTTVEDVSTLFGVPTPQVRIYEKTKKVASRTRIYRVLYRSVRCSEIMERWIENAQNGGVT